MLLGENFREDTKVMINVSLCFRCQVVSLVAMLALSALAVAVYEQHQVIEEHHYVSI